MTVMVKFSLVVDEPSLTPMLAEYEPEAQYPGASVSVPVAEPGALPVGVNEASPGSETDQVSGCPSPSAADTLTFVVEPSATVWFPIDERVGGYWLPTA